MAQVRGGIPRIPMPAELWKKGADMQTPGDLSIPGARVSRHRIPDDLPVGFKRLLASRLQPQYHLAGRGK